MLFTTLGFLVFFALTYLVYWSVRGRARLYVLLVASIAFYSVWSIPFALHFLAMVGFTYLMVRRLLTLPDGRQRNLTLGFTIAVNLTNLFLFKYFYLLLTALYDLTGAEVFTSKAFNLWLENRIGYPEITLPLAISFYTFQLIAFAIDAHRRQTQTNIEPLKFFVFILAFPQLVAGPILRYPDFYPQLDAAAIRPREDYVRKGMFLLMLGLIKKVVVADNMIAPINQIYAAPEEYNAWTHVVAAAAFSCRVFCDFSGYTDVARGIGYLLGFHFPDNFQAPFLRTSLRELWQGWHITLTTWMRDYIYIPLGGNRRSPARNYFNQILTFTLVGAWHGANYTYIMWGFIHGVALALERLFSGMLGLGAKRGADDFSPLAAETQAPARARAFVGRVGRAALALIQGTAVFAVFALGAIYFNSANLGVAHTIIARIFTLASGARSPLIDFMLGMIALTLFFNWLQMKRDAKLPPRWVQYILLTLFGLLTVVLLGRYAPGAQDYIYFQF
jgi:D-alanyl-lipoteichoic acid acyltransferase DltB (MBOAT superfamily)